MLKKIDLEGFKCFGAKSEIALAPITIMYGRNGRGKSTVAQSLLLLAQTMSDSNDVSTLQLMGKSVSLGTFQDIVNVNKSDKYFSIALHSEDETVEMKFEEFPEKPQMARISDLSVNGESRFDEVGDSDITGANGVKAVTTTSDIKILQKLKSARYVSAGRLGPQNSSMRNDKLADDDLGVNGENLISVLSRHGIDFLTDVETVLSSVLGGASLRINFKDADIIELYINSKDGKETFRPVNVGFGYSYVLPVIVAALLAEANDILIIENPEAHLHPGAQSRIMRFLIDVAKEKQLQLIIETHSDHVVNGMRLAMKNGKLQRDDAEVLFFSEDADKPKVILSDENGTLSEYPDDFLDEWTSQMLELM